MTGRQDDVARPLANVEQCTAPWLTRVLHRAGALRRGDVQAVEHHTTCSTTATVSHLVLRYAPDAEGHRPDRLFLKISDGRRLPNLPDDFVLGDARFYARAAHVADSLPVPACYDAAVDETGVRCHVLLEDLAGTHASACASDHPDRSRCHQMVQPLADFHAYWWGHTDLKRFGGLPEEEEPGRYVRSVQQTLPGFLDAIGDSMSADARRDYEHFARDFGPAYASVFRPGHLTVIHGDAHPLNVLLPRSGTGCGRIIDWQFHHVTICTQDIRHTLGLHWPAEARRAIERDVLSHYHQRLVDRGVTGYTWDDCWHGYRVGAIDNLFMPMWQWTLEMPRDMWVPTIDRALAAVRHLHCHDLLS